MVKSSWSHMLQSLLVFVSYKAIFFWSFITLLEETTIPVNSPLTLVSLFSRVEAKFIKDIATLERVLYKAMKCILHVHDYMYATDCKTKLTSLQLLPLMYMVGSIGHTVSGKMLTGQERHNQYIQTYFICWVFYESRQCKNAKPQLLLYVNISSFSIQSCGSVVEFVTCDWLEPEFQFYLTYCISSIMESLTHVLWLY